jgi:amino acid adenylation domain-containing protein
MRSPVIAEGIGLPGAGASDVGSGSSPEEVVARIWAEVLDLPAVEPDEDFFDIGGDSLSAVQILARIQDRFGVRLPLADFFNAPTVRQLCARLEEALPASAPTPVPSEAPLVVDRGPRDRFPVTSSQGRLWFLDRFIAEREAYNVYRLVHLKGNLDPAELREALAALVARHEVLRTSFAVEDGQPVQRVAATVPAELPVEDLTTVPEARRLDAVKERAEAEAAKPFDLAAAPLWRARLWCVGPDDFYLSVVVHHTVFDGWSVGLFFRELSALYEGKKLPPLPLQYGDAARRQEEWRRTPEFQHQLAAWTKTLASPQATLQLPFSKPRPRRQTFRGTTHSFEVPDALARAIDDLGRRSGATRYMVALAAFEAVLHRYTGADYLLIGTPVAGRNRADTEPLIGFFVNTLVLRTSFAGEPTFAELLGRVKATTLDAFSRPEMPLEALIEELKPARDTSRQPLFQILFLYQNVAGLPETFAGCALTPVTVHNGTSMFDLRLVLEDKPGGGLWAWVEFNTDLFDRGAIERLAGHFLTLLEGACAAPETPVAKLPLLTPAEHRQIVHDWNDTAGDFPREALIHQAFEQRVAQAPDAAAVVAGGREFSYREINARANRLAHLLKARGVGRGTFTGVCLRRSDEMIVAVLAILKAGGAYVPLDAAYPKDRLAFMLQDTKAPAVLTESALLDRLPDGEAKLLCIDRLGDELARQSAENPAATQGPDDLAYVIYTSGSTGLPKGVILRHRPVVNILDWVNTTLGVGPSDRLLFVTSLSFDLSVYDIFGVLGAGGSVRVAGQDELRDPARLLGIVKSESITIWDSAPAALQQLAPFFATKHPGDRTDRLRLVMLSGDWIPVPLPDQIRSTFPNARVVSLGGATEAAIWSNWYPVGKVDPSWPSIPYGKPIRNARYHVLDKDLQPTPVGVPGELHIGGDVLADGYLNRAELTAERFIPDPFAKPQAAKLYKTGDLARYFPDGNIEFLGRIDSQVKVRGFRVEVGEIEAVLAQHAAVGDAVVRPHRGADGVVFLAAYVVPRKGHSPTPEELAKHLQTKLPDYMVPAHFLFLDALPMTPNGKVDRKALPDPVAAAAAARPQERAFAPPGNDAERALAALFEEVLNVRPVGATDDFHELGGHSLAAAVLMSQIEAKLGHRVPLDALFEEPTVRGLAGLITRRLELGGGSLVPLQTGGDNPALVMIAGAGGHVFAFHKFARLLGPDYPAYGMKAIGVDGSEPPLDRFEDIAARYVKEILAARPEGPYVLSGYSVGGRIALEVALQLERLGKAVPRLIIFDMYAPGAPKLRPLPSRIYCHARTFLRRPWRGKLAFIRERFANIRGRILYKLKLHKYDAPVVKGLDAVPQNILSEVWGALSRGSLGYQPRGTYRGQVVLVRSAVYRDYEDVYYPDPSKGWSAWSARPVEVREVPAEHTQVFEERYQDMLAGFVRDAIDAAAMETGK